MKEIVIFLIGGYRQIISPFLGNHCRFYPSCSVYALEAFAKKGFFVGLGIAVSRLLKCNPWHPGGIDFVE